MGKFKELWSQIKEIEDLTGYFYDECMDEHEEEFQQEKDDKLEEDK